MRAVASDEVGLGSGEETRKSMSPWESLEGASRGVETGAKKDLRVAVRVALRRE